MEVTENLQGIVMALLDTEPIQEEVKQLPIDIDLSWCCGGYCGCDVNPDGPDVDLVVTPY